MLFAPQGGGHQDKQSIAVTDPCQTEDNYGNLILEDCVSLKPTLSSPTASFPAASWCVSVCASM